MNRIFQIIAVYCCTALYVWSMNVYNTVYGNRSGFAAERHVNAVLCCGSHSGYVFSIDTVNGFGNDTAGNMTMIEEKIKNLIERESRWMPVLSSVSAILISELEDISWAGFYVKGKKANGEKELILGPFQGMPSEVIVLPENGVCGTAADRNRTAAVTWKEQERETGSEIAVPLHNSADEVIMVMNVRSGRADRFDDDTCKELEKAAEIIEQGITGFENPEYAEYRKNLRSIREPVKNPSVVYQGEPGAYSEIAAIDFFGRDADIKGLRSFDDTFAALRNGTADYAVLPIENSSTGVIRQVYDLLAQYQCFMVGETTVSVQHSFMVLPGTKLEDIDTVYSHEQGIFQCEAFLDEHPEWKRIPQEDTAGSARMIAELQEKGKAAICSSRAAEIYGLEILMESINSNSKNTTRFVVISPNMEIRNGSDKICISFMTPHKPGALHEVLTIFTIRGLNLVRLESRPIPEHNWEYMFFVEFTGNLESPGMDDVILSLAETTDGLRVYGNYAANL